MSKVVVTYIDGTTKEYNAKKIDNFIAHSTIVTEEGEQILVPFVTIKEIKEN